MTLLDQANNFLAERHIETPYDVSHDELPSLLTAFAESVTPKWTYCEDAMPAEDELVLISHTWPHTYEITVDTARYTDRGWRWEDDSPVSGANPIIAWMPLPDPAPHRDIPTEKMSQSTDEK